MNLHLCYTFLLIAAFPAASQPLRAASFHVSEFTRESDIERIADIVQQYDIVAIQDLRELAAADELLATLFRRGDFFKILPSNPSGPDATRYAFAWRDRRVQLITPGSFLEVDWEPRPVYAIFRAGDFDFVALNYQTMSPPEQAASQLIEAYEQTRKKIAEEGDVLVFASLAEPTPVQNPLTPILPLNTPVAFEGRSAHSNIYIATHLTKEFNGSYAVDPFEQRLSSGDSQQIARISGLRPVWAEFALDGGDDDGPGIPFPSAIAHQTWGRLKVPSRP